jgi:hypothetical protein
MPDQDAIVLRQLNETISVELHDSGIVYLLEPVRAIGGECGWRRH